MDVRSTSLHKEGKCDHIFFEELVPIMMIIRISLGETSVGSIYIGSEWQVTQDLL
jgi:hypothetical protein